MDSDEPFPPNYGATCLGETIVRRVSFVGFMERGDPGAGTIAASDVLAMIALSSADAPDVRRRAEHAEQNVRAFEEAEWAMDRARAARRRRRARRFPVADDPSTGYD